MTLIEVPVVLFEVTVEETELDYESLGIKKKEDGDESIQLGLIDGDLIYMMFPNNENETKVYFKHGDVSVVGLGYEKLKTVLMEKGVKIALWNKESE